MPPHVGTTAKDAEAMEAAMWADISDRLAIGAVRTASVEVAEQLARCDIIAQRAAYVANLAASLATRSLQAAARAAEEASANAAEAVSWQQILDVAAKQAITMAQDTEELRANHAASPDRSADPQLFSRAQEELSAAEVRVLEMHTKEAAAKADLTAQQQHVRNLHAEADELKESIARLKAEEAESVRRLQERQHESLAARRDLEDEIHRLRDSLHATRDELARAQLETDAAVDERRQAQQELEEERVRARRELDAAKLALEERRIVTPAAAAVDHERVHGSGHGSPEGDAPPMMTASGGAPEAAGAGDVRRMASFGASVDSRGNFDEASASASPRGMRGAEGGDHATIESGLAALQNVRNQLRDLRGQMASSSSPTNRSGSPAGTPSQRAASPPRATYTSTVVASPAGDSLQRASTYSAFPQANAPSSPTAGQSLVGAARLRTSASMILEPTHHAAGAAGPSPWKQRLMKLQGDLRTLRSELGAPPRR